MIRHEPNHATTGLSRLIEQWQGKPVIRAILSAILAECQAVEDAYFQIAESRKLANATGKSLALIGALVGEDPRGRDDDTYRKWIRARIKTNQSSGQFDELIAIFDPLSENFYRFTEYFPAALWLDVDPGSFSSASDAYQMLKQAKLDAVWFALSWSETNDPFSCCSGTTPDSVTLPERGFALTDLSSGGYMSRVFVTPED